MRRAAQQALFGSDYSNICQVEFGSSGLCEARAGVGMGEVGSVASQWRTGLPVQ